MTTTSGPVTDGAEGVVVMALAVVVVEEEEGAMEAARMAERTCDAKWAVPPKWRQVSRRP